ARICGNTIASSLCSANTCSNRRRYAALAAMNADRSGDDAGSSKTARNCGRLNKDPIAVLAVGTITPYVLRLSGLQNRIGFLCDEAHLALVYQPVFDLNTMRPIGCEVLARLQEDKRWW